MANVKYLGERTLIEGAILEIESIESARVGGLLNVCWLDLESQKGMKASFLVESIVGDNILGQVSKILEAPNDKYFTVVLGACRPQMLKRIMEISPTFPIKKIIIVPSENAEKSYLSSNLLKERGYLKYLKKGVEQAGIPYLPEVQVIDKFWSLSKAVAFSEFDTRLVCDGNSDLGIGRLVAEGGLEKEGGTKLDDTKLDDIDIGRSGATFLGEVLVGVGPEGGWSVGELEAFRGWGFSAVHLGVGILRVDVALISTLSILRRDIYQSMSMEHKNLGG